MECGRCAKGKADVVAQAVYVPVFGGNADEFAQATGKDIAAAGSI
jgi:hypothetical protein